MLETTLSTAFIPGTNLKGNVAGANWMFLLPSLGLNRVICLGAPPHTTLTTLASFSQHVVVACPDARAVQRATRAGEAADLASLQLLTIGDEARLPLPDHCADLVLITGGRMVRWLRRHPALRAEIGRLLQPDGLLYYEYRGPVDPLNGVREVTEMAGDAHVAQNFWLTPLNGEMHTAVPRADRETIHYVLEQGLYSPSLNVHLAKRAWQAVNKRRRANATTPRRETSAAGVKNRHASPLRSTAKQMGRRLMRTLGAAEGALSGQRLLGPLVRRHGVLRGRAVSALSEQPPTYLRQMAQAAGVDLADCRWGLVARGDYSSRKLLFFLFRRSNERSQAHVENHPTHVVKMVRDPRFNARLENEDRALRLLQAHGIGDRATLPRVRFSGHHAGLAVVGETAVTGEPFRQCTHSTADCPYAGAAIEWLTDLATATVDPMAAPGQVAATLEVLFARFAEIYALSPDHYAFLADHIAAIQQSRIHIPLVFQHGDPGPWNMLVTPCGRVALLDWEAAEPQGLPLWDLFYFLRSFAVGVARTHGARDALAGFEQQLLAETPLRQRVMDATQHYCARVGLASDAVAPLFYTCWMHRALKEATRLQPAQLEQGHYVNLLRLCIDSRSSISYLWSV